MKEPEPPADSGAPGADGSGPSWAAFDVGQVANLPALEGGRGCDMPPLYTNNKLTLAEGFTPSEDGLERLDILPISAGTDPGLAVKTRRGTGFYKVPSLRGVWY